MEYVFIIFIYFYKVILTHFKEIKKIPIKRSIKCTKDYYGICRYVLFIIVIYFYNVIPTHFKENKKIYMM